MDCPQPDCDLETEGVVALDVVVDWAVTKPVMARMRAVVYCMLMSGGVCLRIIFFNGILSCA
jgi:hypothetical protein